MDGFNGTELLTRAVKYFLEGLAVAVAMVIIPRKTPHLEEIAVVATTAANCASSSVRSDRPAEAEVQSDCPGEVGKCCSQEDRPS